MLTGHLASPPGSTGLPSLDARLLAANANNASPLNRGDVLEIQGPAASGKTQLLYHLVAQCILPRIVYAVPAEEVEENETNETGTGGWERVAVVLDTDGRFDVRRLRRVLEARLSASFSASGASSTALAPTTPSQSQSQPPPHTHLTHLTLTALTRFHLFRPLTSASLVATLHLLPAYLCTHAPLHELGLLALDSASAFFWEDKYALEARVSSDPGSSEAAQRQEGARALDRTLALLQSLRTNYGPVLVLTNWALNAPIPLSVSVSGPDTQFHLQAQAQATASTPFPFVAPSAPPLSVYHQHLHPFPAPFDPSRRSLPNAHLYPPITHHISLQPPRHKTRKLLQLQFHVDNKGQDNAADASEEAVVGVIRTVEGGITASFEFRIGDSGIR